MINNSLAETNLVTNVQMFGENSFSPKYLHEWCLTFWMLTDVINGNVRGTLNLDKANFFEIWTTFGTSHCVVSEHTYIEESCFIRLCD